MSTDDPVNSLPLSKLIDYVKARDKVSEYELVKRAAKRGLFDLSQQQINLFRNQPMKAYPKPKTIETLAAALDLTYQQVLNACTRDMGYPHVWRPGATVISDEQLSPEQVEEYGQRVRRAARGKGHQQ